MATQCATAVRREPWEQCGTADIAEVALPCGAIDHSPQTALRPSTDTPTGVLLHVDRLLPFATAPLDAEYAVAQEEMGRGEFGVVRACMARRSGQLLACKSVEKARLCGERRGDLEMELLCMAALPPHPHVVRLASVHEDARRVHLVMDLCDGGDLFDLVARAGRLPERCAAAVLAQAASAVAWCHAHGVLHLDVKPENLLLAGLSAAPLLADAHSAEAALAHVSVKLADFGQAVAVGAGGRARGLAGSSLYMAPEVVCGREYDSAADMWSVGVVLYVMLAGYVPFYGPDLPHVFLAICRGHPDLTGEAWEGVSDEAKQLVRSLLSVDPASRPSACDLLSHPWLTAHVPAATAAAKVAREAANAAVRDVLTHLACATSSGASTTPACPSLHAASSSSSLQSTAHLVQVEAPTGHYECIKPEEQAAREGQQRQAGREEGMREATHKLQASHGTGKPQGHEAASEASVTAQQQAAQQQGAEAAQEARSGLTGMLAGICEKMGHAGEALLGGAQTATEESAQAAREGVSHTRASAGVPAGRGYEQSKDAPYTASHAPARGAGTAAGAARGAGEEAGRAAKEGVGAAARGAGMVAGTVQGLAEEGGAAGKRGVEGAGRGVGTAAGVVQGAAEEAGHAAREGSKAAARGAGSVAGVARGVGEEAGKAAKEGSQAAARGAGTVAGTVQALGEEGREVGKQAIGSAARGVGAVGGTAQAVGEMASEAASEGVKMGARGAGEVYGTVQGAADVGSHVASDVGQQVKQGAQAAAQGAARGVGSAAGVVQGAGEAAGRAALEGRREVGDAVGAAGVGTAEAARGVVGGATHAVGTAASAVGGGAYDTVEGVGQAIGGLGLTVAGGVQSMLGGVAGAVGGGVQSLVDSVRGAPHAVGEAVQGHAQQVQAERGSGDSGTEGKGAEDVISRRVDVVEGMRMGGEDIAGIVGAAGVPAGDMEGVEGLRVIVVTEDKVVRE
ncbi:unnamed protein product [Closterium sp. NIES-64]|nr:unnamed protein product [Closterium sp. NIES-65]CAI6005320.1 unnamed protein product [Closterium sp. NIES-64]